MLLYINNQSIYSDEYMNKFYKKETDERHWLKDSILVGMGPFINEFLTNGSYDVLVSQNKAYECISNKYSSISNVKVKHFFLIDRDNNTVVKKPEELKTQEDAIMTTASGSRMIFPSEEGKEILKGFYNEKSLDDYQVFEFMNIEVPNIRDPYKPVTIKVDKFIVNIQFIYNKRTGVMLTYLYNIKAIPEYGPEWDMEKDGKGIPNEFLLYKLIIPTLDHMEISFDLKVE